MLRFQQHKTEKPPGLPHSGKVLNFFCCLGKSWNFVYKSWKVLENIWEVSRASPG